MTRHRRLPDFLFIGPDKAGSTWLDRAFRAHPDVFLPRAKELFFFDRFFDKGIDWYSNHFSTARVDQIAGEISHDYLFSDLACDRIASVVPNVRLIVCLREPVQRAYSAYLYMVKQGRTNASFDVAMHEIEELTDHGRYSSHLSRYLARFGRSQLHIAVFDELVRDSSAFFDKICQFLCVPQIQLAESLRGKSLPASRSRIPALTRTLRRSAWAIRRLGIPGIISIAKSSPYLNRLLFQEYSSDSKPNMSPHEFERCRSIFAAEVAQLDDLLGTSLRRLWGYET